jgi:hypothetical protein
LDDQGQTIPNFTFAAPVTLTLHYTDADIKGIVEKKLRLYYWDTDKGKWADAANTCTPISDYTRDPVNNTLTVQICHLSEFALLGDAFQTLFLPSVRR